MATLRDALTSITTGITQVLDPDIDVAEHPGRFTEPELGQIVTKKRAVRVAIEALPQVNISGPGKIQAQLLMSAFVICGDSHIGPRHQVALDIVHQLLRAVPHQRWGQTYLRPALPASLSVDNLYNGEIDRRGISLWAIAWQQGYQDQ
jgi:hypothetical protein